MLHRHHVTSLKRCVWTIAMRESVHEGPALDHSVAGEEWRVIHTWHEPFLRTGKSDRFISYIQPVGTNPTTCSRGGPPDHTLPTAMQHTP